MSVINNYWDIRDNIQSDKKIWEEIRERAAEQGIPIHGHFELTPRCNLNCKMCYVHLQHNQINNSMELSFNDWKEIIDQAISEGMIFASLSGGECLISPYFDDIYTYLHLKGIMITVLTNGILLDKKIELFNKMPPAYIQVSVYGDSEEQYEVVTGVRCYTLVKNNINSAILCGLPIGIAITPNKYLKNISNIIRYYKKKKISITVGQWLMPPYSSTGRELDDFNLSPEEQVEISKEIWQITESEKLITYEGELPEIGYLKDGLEEIGIRCAAGRSDFSISWFGAMSMCVSFSEPLGFPLIEGFSEVWKKTKDAARKFQMPRECGNCAYKKVCKHCPAQHLLSAERGRCSKSVCEETKLMVKEGILKL